MRRTSVQDGTTLHTYSPDNGPLSSESNWSNGIRFPRPKDVILIGPTEQQSVPELLTWLSSWGDGTKAAQVTGYERVGNWDTAVIEYVSGTMWVEPNEMLIVRHVSDSIDIRVTAFSRTDFDESLVRLPASVAVRPSPTPWDDATSPRPPGLAELLAPTYSPWPNDGPSYSYSCWPSDDCVTEQILMSEEQFWQNQRTPGVPARGGVHILLQQRTGLAAMPEPMKRGLPMTVRGVAGYVTEAPGLVVLDWQEPDGRLVHMEGVDVSRDEVFKVAESLELRQQ